MKIQFHFLSLFFVPFILNSCFFGGSNEGEMVYEVKVATGIVLTGVYNSDNIQHIGYINNLSGIVLLDGSVTKIEDAFSVGSKITTATGGFVEILFRDHSVMRLDENSSLEIMPGIPGETKIRLQDGKLWSRILQPFTSSDFYTLETSDVSAGVRGTSLLLRTHSGVSELVVLDTMTGGMSRGVVWQDKNNLTLSGTIYHEEQIIFTSGALTGSGKTKIDIFSLISNDQFVRENTKKDLRYMQSLIKQLDPLTSSGVSEKILSEISMTLPTPSELASFFQDNDQKEHVTLLLGSGVTLDEFLFEIERQDKILEIQNNPNISDDEKKASLQKLKEGLLKKIIPETSAPITPQTSKTQVSSPVRTAVVQTPSRGNTTSGEVKKSISGE